MFKPVIISAIALCCLVCSCRISHRVAAQKTRATTILDNDNFGRVELPFREEENGIIVRVKLESPIDTTADFLFDSGSFTMLSKKFCDDNHIPYQNDSSSNNIRTASRVYHKNEIKRYLMPNVTYIINGLKIIKPAVSVIDLDKMNHFQCTQVAGVIGSDFMDKFGLYMDFKNHRIVLYDRHSAPDSLANYDYKLFFMPIGLQRVPVVNLGVNGRRYNCTWDLGYASGVFIQYNNRKALEDLWAVHPEFKTFATKDVFGDIEGMEHRQQLMYITVTDSFKNYLSPFLCPATEVDYRYNQNLKNENGSIGVDFMKRFRMYMDWRHRTIYLKKEIRYDILDSTAYQIGDYAMNYDFDSHTLVIKAVDINSTEYAAGLRPGDRVLKAGDKDTKDLDATISICNAGTVLRHFMKGCKTILVENTGKKSQIVIPLNKILN